MGINFTRNFTKPFSNPKAIFWYYVLLNMIPSIFLFFTEPLNIWGKIVLILFPLGLYLFILSLWKKTGGIQLILFPLTILHAFQIVLLYLFGEAVIAVDMFLNVVTTNASEAGEVLNSIWPSIVFVILLYIPAIIIAVRQCRLKIYLDSDFRKKSIPTGVLLVVLSYFISFGAKDLNTEKYAYHNDVYPINVLYNLNFAVNKWKRSNAYLETSKDFIFNAHRDSSFSNREIYVMVIGETSRAENWSLYGYERKTTPYLDEKQGLIHFSDAITQSNTTHKSVSIMLSAASAENYDIIYKQKSIIQAFKEIGFKTVFLSNQGVNHTFTEYFGKEADLYQNIRSVDNLGLKTINNFDEALLPLFENCIDSISGNLFIILHTYGSHFNYRERYPNDFSVFKPDNVTGISRKEKERLQNAYDNTILYTDNFLSDLIDILEKQDIYSSMFFSSDHGEDILDDKRMRFLHASPSPTFYQLKIPMFVWFSEKYRTDFSEKVKAVYNNKDKPVATNAIFHTLLDIASIETDYFDADLSLTREQFKKSKRMYLDDHDNPIFFYNVNLKKEDKEMIKKRNMFVK